MTPTQKVAAAGAGIALLAAAATLSIRMAMLPDHPAPQHTASPRPTVSPSPQLIASVSPLPIEEAQGTPSPKVVKPLAKAAIARAAAAPGETIAMPPCDNQPSITGDILRTGKATWQVILVDPPTVFPCTLGPLKTTMPQYGPDASDVEVTITFTKRAQ